MGRSKEWVKLWTGYLKAMWLEGATRQVLGLDMKSGRGKMVRKQAKTVECTTSKQVQLNTCLTARVEPTCG